MTEKSFPFSEGPGAYVTEDDWAAMTSGFQDTGVYGHPGSPDLTIEPGSEPGTIELNAGDAQVLGFHYRLTSTRVINTVSNAGSEDRIDTVALHLDAAANVVEPVLLQDTREYELGNGYLPLGEWTQPPATEVTSEFWGSARDVRWFSGARMRPVVNGSFPPAVPGGLCYDPEEGERGTLYLGVLDDNDSPHWVPWMPLSPSRTSTVQVFNDTNVSTTSTNFVAGNPQLSTTFIAPPSGQVIVTVYAQLSVANGRNGHVSYEIRENNSSGTVVVQPSTGWAAANAGNEAAGSTNRRLISGLAPGETYFIRTMHRTSNSSGALTVFMRTLLVEPVYTEVTPGVPDDDDTLDPSDVVLTSGGSIIRIPNGDTSTSALGVRIPAGDRSTAVETFGFYINQGTDEAPSWNRKTFFDGSGNLRVIPSSGTDEGLVVQADPTQSADLISVKDSTATAVAGFRSNGGLYAPNFTPLIVLGPTDPIPEDIEPGTVILRTE